VKPYNFINNHKYDLILLLFLVIIGVKYIFNVSGYTDITLWDESRYLDQGLNLFKKGLPDVNWSPLYAIHYYILSIYQHDAIKLYYLNYIVMTVMMPISSYIYFRAFDIGKLPAFLFSIILLISQANYDMCPKASLFALYIIFFSAAIIRYSNKTEYKLLFACVSLFILSFARPEFMISFILMLTIFAMYSTISGFKYKKYTSLKMCLGLLILIIISYLAIGLPIISKEGERSYLAFGQHFSRNMTKLTGSEIDDPWTQMSKGVERSYLAFGQHFSLNMTVLEGKEINLRIDIDPWTHWEKITREFFGSAKTIREALINNPSAFFEHVKCNINSIPRVLLDLIKYQYNISWQRQVGISLVIILLLCPIIILSYANIVLSIKNIKQNTVLLAFMLSSTIPSIISAILIYPETHYLLPLFVIILTFIVVIISSITYEPDKLKLYISYGILFIFVVPCLSDYQPTQPYLENKNVLQVIRNLNLTKPVNLLEIDGGYNIYLTPNFHWFYPNDPSDTDFDTFLLDKKINMIVFSYKLLNYYKYKTPENKTPDNKMLHFISHYPEYGFSKIYVSRNMVILLHKSLI